MRPFVLLLAFAGACRERGDPAGPAEGGLPVLEAHAVAPGAIVLDGKFDRAWKAILRDLVVPLEGPGPAEVRLKAAHDGERLYLLAVWKDAERSMNRYWRYRGDLEWQKHVGEDAFSVWWSPPALADAFRAQGCALFCHGGRHVYTDAARGFADVWYYGTQQCALSNQARDMWLPFGDNQRLRGDRQPANSDTLPNISNVYEGPRYWPQRINASVTRLLARNNLIEVTPDRIKKFLVDGKNVGREIPLDILQPRRGSRGDVAYEANFYPGQGFVLELSRRLDTGNPDDIVLSADDPLLSYPFAVALHDGTAGGEHAISGPLELRFLRTK